MSDLTILSESSNWHARSVRYVAGNWDSILSIIPEFELGDFTAGPDEPVNPLLKSVVRRPLTKAERPIPVGVVSNSYGLAQHRKVAALCRQGLLDGGVGEREMSYEVGLSELGEWMNLRIRLSDRFGFTDGYNEPVDLRLECFNSVDGSSRLVIYFGWVSLICTNGLVIRESKIEIKERHGRTLDIESIPERIRPALAIAQQDQVRMRAWARERVAIDAVEGWANDDLADSWGARAAARVFHICRIGRDVEFIDPFAAGLPTEKPVRPLARVLGSPERAGTKYDVSQSLSFVASRRNNAEERIAWQASIPSLLDKLPCASA